MADRLEQRRPLCEMQGFEEGLDLLWSNRLAHGRRHFVDSLANFPDEMRYVLGTLGPFWPIHERRWSGSLALADSHWDREVASAGR